MKECPMVRFAILAAALLLAARASAQSLVISTIANVNNLSVPLYSSTGPAGIAVDPTGNLYIADPIDSVVQKLSPTGIVVMTVGQVGSRGSVDGPLGTGQFNTPTGVALDAAGNLYVTDQMNSTIRRITPSGTMSTLAGTPNVFGHHDGTGGSALFCQPTALAIDTSGDLYVADGANANLSLPNPPGICIRKVTPAGVVTTVSTLAGITAAYALPFNLMGIAVDGQGNLYVSVGPLNQSVAYVANPTIFPPPNGNAIFMVSPAGAASLYAGQPSVAGSADGPALQALFSNPGALAFDAAGNLYVSDNYNETIRMVSPAGVVTTIAGLAGRSGIADGLGSQAWLRSPYGLVFDAYGNLFFNDDRFTRRGIPSANTQGPVRFVNMSARGTVSPSSPLIGGFVVEGTVTQTVLARGVGPALAQFGVPNPLPVAQLDIYDQSGSLVASTAAGINWGNCTDAGGLAGAFSLFPMMAYFFGAPYQPPGDAALVITLKPGVYTAVVSSPNGGTGTALVEVYEVP